MVPNENLIYDNLLYYSVVDPTLEKTSRKHIISPREKKDKTFCDGTWALHGLMLFAILKCSRSINLTKTQAIMRKSG